LGFGFGFGFGHAPGVRPRETSATPADNPATHAAVTTADTLATDTIAGHTREYH